MDYWKSLPKYTCPRCGYISELKGNIRNHFNRKNTCPGIAKNIELTNEVKENVLVNRIYVPSEDKNPTRNETSNTINNNTLITINNYNTWNNHISRIDMFDKLNTYSEFKQIQIENFNDQVDDKYHNVVTKLKNNGFRYGYELKSSDFLQVIDDVSTNDTGKLENMNIFYDDKSQKIKILEDGVWESYLVDSGIDRIIFHVKECYLDSYECFLIRNIKSDSSLHKRQTYLETLHEYYKFVKCFDVKPFIQDNDDGDIMINTSMHHEYTIQEEMYKLYKGIVVSKSDFKDVRKKVLDLLRKNSNKGINEVNKKVCDLFHMDEDFRKIVIRMITPSRHLDGVV